MESTQDFSPVILHRVPRALVRKSILEEVRVPAICGAMPLITEPRDNDGRTIFEAGNTIEHLTLLCPDCQDFYEGITGATNAA